jgi:hypothetical protein
MELTSFYLFESCSVTTRRLVVALFLRVDMFFYEYLYNIFSLVYKRDCCPV